MKFFTTLLAGLLLFCSVTAQKITVDEIDKFTKERRLQTSPVELSTQPFEHTRVHFRTVDTSMFIIFSGNGRFAQTVDVLSPIMLLLSNDSTVTIYSTNYQSYTDGKYGNSYRHQYTIFNSDLAKLAAFKIVSIRKYFVSGYLDADISQKKQDALMKPAQLILSALSK